MTEGLDLKPRTVGELLDASFIVYRRRFWKLLLAATLVSLPTLVLSAAFADMAVEALVNYAEFFLRAAQGPEGMQGDFWDQYWERIGDLQILSIGQALLQALSRGAGAGVMAIATWYVVRRKELPSAWALIIESLPRLPTLVFAYFLITQALGFLCLCPPVGVLAMVAFMPASAAMMLERGRLEMGVRAKMDQDGPATRFVKRTTLIPLCIAIDGTVRGFSLSFDASALGRGTLYSFFLFLFMSFFEVGVSAAAGGLIPALGIESYGPVFWSQHYAEVVILPALGVGVTLWYFDLRTRREGLDLLSEVGATT